jgi:hypothetical protein
VVNATLQSNDLAVITGDKTVSIQEVKQADLETNIKCLLVDAGNIPRTTKQRNV